MIRRRYRLRGVVQGVGFRPHAAQVAARFEVTGFCGNDSAQVFLEVQGQAVQVDAFFAELLATLPPLACVTGVDSEDIEPRDPGVEDGFAIVSSQAAGGARTLIPPDVATCADCLAELHDPTNRRFQYPFITCTNCGPRLTIIEDLPYDRPATTMRGFEMCAACRREYTDPTDRRYHAQPISCFDCGPRLWLDDQAGLAAVAEARRRFAAGQVLAVKGLGGFHLMCDARNEAAVARLRARKRGSGKPFAVLVADLAAAGHLAELAADHLALLASPAHPIVIAAQSSTYDLAASVAPGLRDVGLMLPYTPLHELLVAGGLALVATSGNLADEPLCYTNDQARTRLGGFVDGFVEHDRDIHVPVEDSVFLESTPLRRSRGYAPLPVAVPPGPVVLAVGGEIKNTFALASGDYAFVSAHIGDQGSLAAQSAFAAAVSQLLTIHRVRPEVVVCDLHPNYATTAWAEKYCAEHDLELRYVQHHYAHALALLAESGRFSGPAVVAALDGTGYGLDGTIWGGEIIALGSDLSEWTRAAHVPVFGLVGGDRAVRQPWRVALGLAHAWGLDVTGLSLGPTDERRLVESQLASGFGVVPTSSLGRVFDAASALLGICVETSYEAQAAMELEQFARDYRATDAATDAATNEPPVTTWPEAIMHLLDDSRPREFRAWAFHQHVAELIAAELIAAARAADTRVVGVSGGCAVNRLFVAALRQRLHTAGYELLTHRVVPTLDGGLSLGQVLAGRLRG